MGVFTTYQRGTAINEEVSISILDNGRVAQGV